MHSGITQGVRRSQDTYRGHRYPLTDGAGHRAELPQSEDLHLSVLFASTGDLSPVSHVDEG